MFIDVIPGRLVKTVCVPRRSMQDGLMRHFRRGESLPPSNPRNENGLPGANREGR